MKKTILVAAIAVVMAAPAAAIEVDMYGNIRLSLRSDSDARIDSSKLIIGWKGSEDLGNGMTAGFKLEMEHDDANEKVSGWDNDRSWVDLKGDFGRIVAGREDGFDGWVNGGTDIFAINGGNVGSTTNELENGIQYRYSGGMFQFGIGAELFTTGQDGVSSAVNTTYGISVAGDNWQFGVMGSNADDNGPTGDPIGITVGALGDVLADGSLAGPGDQGSATNSASISAAIAPGDTSLDIGGYYTLGNFTLGFTLADDGSDANEDALGVVLAFPLGPCGALIGWEGGDSFDVGAGPDGGDIVNLGYNCSSGAAYYGLEYNDDDSKDDALFIAYYGLRW